MNSRRTFLKSAALLGAAPLASTVAPRAVAAPAPAPAAKPDVKITAVNAYIVDRAILVEVASDAGISGWGECAFDGAALMKTFVERSVRQCPRHAR